MGITAFAAVNEAFRRESYMAEHSRAEWGARVDLTGLKEIYAPQHVEAFTVPRGGIDNLALHSTDVFTIPGHGEFTVEFAGYFRVARANPTTTDWATSEVRVNIIDLKLLGRHEGIGEIAESLNPGILSSGQIFPTTGLTKPKACRIATAAVFHLGQMGVSVFNKEPILLMNKNVTRIPPVDDPSGHALLFMLPLHDLKHPDGEAVAYLTSLHYGADNYITKAEATAFREKGEPGH